MPERWFCQKIVTSILFLTITFGSDAGTLSPQESIIIERNQDRILQQHEQQQKAIEQQQKQQQKPSGLAIDRPELPQSTSTPDDTCFDISTVDFDGDTKLSSANLDSLRKPYLDQCLTLDDIDNLIRDVTNLYIDKGYVTTRAYLPEQDIQDGSLLINLVEGTIESVILQEGTYAEKKALQTVFPELEGKILNIRDLEQGLDQMNRLPSNNVTLELLPGKEVGTTSVQIKNKNQKSFRLYVGMDNSGSRSTGTAQRKFRLGKDNLFKVNDSWLFSISNDNLDSDIAKSRNIAVSFSVPYGYWTLSAASNYFEYTSSVASTNTTFSTSGNSFVNSISINRIVHRNQRSKTSFDIGVTSRKNLNFIQGNRIDVGSRKLSIGKLGLNHSHQLLGGLLTLNFVYERGLRILGALEDVPALAYGESSAQFEKYTNYLSYNRPIIIKNKTRALYSVMFSGQHSDDDLFSSEQISVGGQRSVRGFKEEILSGDTGGYIRNQLDIYLPQVKTSYLQHLFSNTNLYVAYDIGTIKKDAADVRERGSVSGWGIGLRKSSGALTWELTYAQALSSPSFINTRSYESFVNVGLNY